MTLRIEKPCNEDWSKMTPNERGAFCQFCSKDVIDFQGKTSLEIKNILIEQQNNQSSTCGRFHTYQLDQFNEEFVNWKSDEERVRTIWLLSAMIVFGITLFSCQSTLSKEVVEKMQISGLEMLDEESQESTDETQKKPLEDPFEISKPSVYLPPPYFNEYDGFEEITIAGPVPNLEGICMVQVIDLTGFTVLTGSISPRSENEEIEIDPLQIHKSLSDEETIQAKNLHQGHNSPIPNPPSTSNALAMTAVLSGRGEDFDASIEGVPVNANSRIILTLRNDMDLLFTLVSLSHAQILSSQRLSFNEGIHKLHLRGNLLNAGNYEMRITSLTEEKVLDFEIGNNIKA